MPVTARTSLKWELILDGAVRKYPDQREVCCDTRKGEEEYQRRIEQMSLRQHGICSRGPHLLRNPTFDHSTKCRGMGSAFRNDAIVDKNGEPINSASCYTCNGAAGSVGL